MAKKAQINQRIADNKQKDSVWKLILGVTAGLPLAVLVLVIYAIAI